MKKKAIKESLLTSVGLTTGAIGSRVVADKLPIKNSHLKRGGLVLAGVVAAAAVGRKTASKAFVQDMALGTAVTQLGYWIKDTVSDKMNENSLMKTALGSPVGDYHNPVQFRMGYANIFPKEQTFDTTYEDVSSVKFTI